MLALVCAPAQPTSAAHQGEPSLTVRRRALLPSPPRSEYVEQIAWYDSVIRQDDYVLGATIYQLEIPGWPDYDVSNAIPDLIQYMNSL
jgi:hypothetical protein